MNYEFKGSTVNGKWKVDVNDNDEPCVILSSRGWNIGVSYVVEELGQPDFAMEDAHLISAAPELLQACIDVLQSLEMHNMAPQSRHTLQQAIHKALNIQP